MVNTHILIAIGCLAVLIIFLTFKVVLRKKNVTTSKESNSEETFALNNKNQDNKKLTLQERIELSWKFLYDITEVILNKFSKEDIILVNKCGRVLLENGARYEHIVDLAVPRTKSHTQSIEQDQTKAKKALGV
ncbi:MAG: DUF2660 domain-containing protein [Rickettsia endosymbiont of Argas persicus]